MSKVSIRFYNDHEVRAVWDEEHSKWWFSVLDIVGAFNDQADRKKNSNYWKYLKAKLKKENSELVSRTNQLKLTAADGKRYATDVVDSDGVVALARNIPTRSTLTPTRPPDKVSHREPTTRKWWATRIMEWIVFHTHDWEVVGYSCGRERSGQIW